jgi:hypothetical protein
MFRIAFEALSFLFFIIVPLLSYDEPNVSLIQTARFVRLSLTGHNTATVLISERRIAIIFL